MKYQLDPWSNVKIGFDVDKSFSMELEMLPSVLSSEKMRDAEWYIGTGGSIAAKPLIIDGIVYFGACDKNLYAVSLEDGKELWRFPTNGQIYNSDCVLHEGVLFFGSLDGCIYAVSTEGKLAWKFKTQGGIFCTPQIKGDVIYFSSVDKNFYAISLGGKFLWKFALDSKSLNVSIDGDLALVPCMGGNLYAISIPKRNLVWRFSGKGLMFPPPAIKDGVAYQGCNDNNIYAIDTRTGREIWRFTGGNAFDTGSLIHGNLILQGCRDNNFYAIDRRTGKKVWSFKTGSMLSWKYIARDGVVYFGSWDNCLYAVNVNSGRLVWKFKTQGPIDNGPEISGDRLVFGSYDCNLYCLDLQGKLVWKFPTSISTPIKIDLVLQGEQEISLQTIWKASEEEKAIKNELIEIRDYANRESEYSTGRSKDYIKGKKGYI